MINKIKALSNLNNLADFGYVRAHAHLLHSAPAAIGPLGEFAI